MNLTNTNTLDNYISSGETLSSFCSMPSKSLAYLQEYYVSHGKYRSLPEIVDDLNCDYADAVRQNTLKVMDDRMIFSSYTRTGQPEHVDISVKLSTFGKYPMFLHFVKFQTIAPQTEPNKSLEQFAFLGSWQLFLSELAAKVSPEDWNFSDVDKSFPVLCQYIKYTFYRLQCENKIAIAPDRSLAAFNTGLHNTHYEAVYACFVPNTTAGGSPWRFAEFATAGNRTYGKMMSASLPCLPEAAEYITRLDQLLISTDKQILVDYEHVILDNINRYPKTYLKSLTTDDTFYKAVDSEDADTLAEYLNNTTLFNRIRNDISSELVTAINKTKYDFRTAIPCYFPKGNRVTLMLPLYLTGKTLPDLALVVELTSAGHYQGQTVLTMQQAYSDARVIGELTNTWLDRFVTEDFETYK